MEQNSSMSQNGSIYVEALRRRLPVSDMDTNGSGLIMLTFLERHLSTLPF